jgi:hypothetical protein
MNETAATYTAVRIGDTSDWKLIVVISETGMSAWLKNIVNPTEEVIELFVERWERNSDMLLSNIENAVYDHPQVLDDFSADIAIVAPRSVWVEPEYAEADDDETAELYNLLYNADEEDVMQEESADALCLYTLVPGLKAFLQRSFPGARIHSHIAVLAKRFRERGSDMPCIFIDIRENEADFVVFDNRRFLFAATHTWQEVTDIEYHLYNLVAVLGIKLTDLQVSLSGLRDVKSSLIAPLRERIPFVMHTMLPSMGAKSDMPLVAMLLTRN